MGTMNGVWLSFCFFFCFFVRWRLKGSMATVSSVYLKRNLVNLMRKKKKKKRYILIIRARLLGLELLFEIRILASDYTCVRIAQGTRWALSPENQIVTIYAFIFSPISYSFWFIYMQRWFLDSSREHTEDDRGKLTTLPCFYPHELKWIERCGMRCRGQSIQVCICLGFFFFFGPGSLLLLLRLKSDRFHFYGLTRNPVMNCKLSLSVIFFFLLSNVWWVCSQKTQPSRCCRCYQLFAAYQNLPWRGWPAWHRTNSDTPRLGIITPRTSFFYPAVVSPIRAFGQVTRFDPWPYNFHILVDMDFMELIVFLSCLSRLVK